MTTTELLPPGAYPITIHCCKCGAPIDTHSEVNMSDPATAALVERIMRLTVCATCQEDVENQHHKRKLRERYAEWKSVCPSAFLETKRETLPKPHKFDQAMAWTYGAKGLCLHGASRGGKSRTAWKVCEREFVHKEREVRAVDCTFGSEYAAKAKVSSLLVWEWMEELTKVPLLLADDVFKIKLTDAAELALFALVNSRTENSLPIILTTNDTGETLKKRLSPDRAEPLYQRIKEFTTAISF